MLENGEELAAPLVVTTLHPKIAFLDHLPRTELPEDFVSDIERWNTRSGVVKINLALSELPSFTANPSTGLDGGLAEHHTGSVEMSPSMEFIERAFQDAREGRAALLPFSDGVIPTTLDKTLNPDGTHIFSLFTQYVPHEWSEAPHTEELEAYADRLIDLYDQVAPGFAASVTHRDIVGPHEMEEEYGLIGGNIFHGELTPEQLFHMRPAPGYADYRTPIAGLYNGSSATHGGGGVCGIPGWQAAKAAIKDRRSRWQRLRRRGEVRWLRKARSARLETTPTPSRATLDARSVALVGASPRPGSLGQRMVDEVLRSPGLRAGLAGQPVVRRGGRPPVPALLAALDAAPDLVLLGVGDTPPGRPAQRGRGGRRPRRRRLRQRARGRRTRPAPRRSRTTPGWRWSARAAWASGTYAAACAPWATPSATTCRSGRCRWSPTPARCSRRCCAPGCGSASTSRCRPVRSW